MLSFRSKFAVPKRIIHAIPLLTLLAIFYVVLNKVYSVPQSNTVELFPNYFDTNKYVVSDVQVKSVWFNRRLDVPPGYITLPLKPLVSWKHYYVLLKLQSAKEAPRVLVDLSFTPIDIDIYKTSQIVEISEFQQVSLYQKYHINSADSIAPDLPIVKAIEIFQGNDDFHDTRPFWNSFPVPGFSKQPIYPFFSMLRMSQQESASFINDLTEFNKLRAAGLIDSQVDKFKILQLSDLHFGLDKGTCNDISNCKSDLRTLKFINQVLIKEKPQLVVITGDLFDLHRIHSADSTHFKSVILKSLQPILQNRIPFIFTFGDSEIISHPSNLSVDVFKLSIINFLSTLPYCYNVLPADYSMHGKTNYNLQVSNAKNDDYLMITVLDSELNKLTDSQINFVHRLDDSKYKLAFFHFPIPQHRPSGKFKLVGSYNEKHPLLTETSKKFLQDFIKCGYQVISVGHEHENDACLLSKSDEKQIWLCYSSVSGDSGETKLIENFDRRVRLFELNWAEGKLLSWKVGENEGKGFDYQLIYQAPQVAK